MQTSIDAAREARKPTVSLRLAKGRSPGRARRAYREPIGPGLHVWP
jgi:hypothetical protein